MSISGNALACRKAFNSIYNFVYRDFTEIRVFIQNILIEMFVGLILFVEDSEDFFKPILSSFVNKAKINAENQLVFHPCQPH